jgi:hypothetical protein
MLLTKQDVNKQIESELAWKELIEAIKPRTIDVQVDEGVVTLSGVVDSYSKKMNTEHIVSNLPGVRVIQNYMEVTLTDSNKKENSELTNDILTALVKNSTQAEENFAFEIENEWLTIIGEAQNSQGHKVLLKGKICKLEEVGSAKNNVSAKIEESIASDWAYWEIFQ